MRNIKIIPTITNRESDSLERYLQEISKIEMIGVEEEAELARKIHNGDEKALEALVCANLRFVVSVAKQYQGQGLGLIDLINEGNVGLITAARRFDETRGFKFISYAVWWIRQSIIAALADQSRVVRLPQNQVENLTKVARFFNLFVQENERQPSVEEIAEATGLETDNVEIALRSSSKHMSIDAPLVEDEDGCLIDMLFNNDAPPTDSALQYESLRAEVQLALAQLSKRERQVITMYFGLDGREYTLEEIGETIHLGRERVRQIKEKAILLLRNAHESSILRTYLS